MQEQAPPSLVIIGNGLKESMVRNENKSASLPQTLQASSQKANNSNNLCCSSNVLGGY